MNDAGQALRKAYTALLAGLIYNNQPVKVYSLIAPSGAVAPYVVLGPWQERKANTKHSFGVAGEINLDVVMRLPVGISSTSITGEIAGQINNLVKPTVGAEVLAVEGYNSFLTVIEAMQDAVQPTSTDTIIRKIITISHQLEPI